MPKCNRSRQAAILSPEQLDALMEHLDPLGRAVFQTARFTAGRINEVLSLTWSNIYEDCLVFPKAITKKKVRTREIPMNPKLQCEIATWKTSWPDKFGRDPDPNDFVFPVKADISKHVTRRFVDKALRSACTEAGLHGVSTHSFRRSALTAASDAGCPLRHIQELSGHGSLSVLQAYLSCTEKQKRAVALAFG